MDNKLDALLTSIVVVLCAAMTPKFFPQWEWLTYDRVILFVLLVHVKYLRIVKQDQLEKKTKSP